MEEARLAVWLREQGRCEGGCGKIFRLEGCWEWHHCHFRRKYQKSDMNDEWNGALLCADCHDKLHFKPGGRALADELRKKADIRKPIHLRSTTRHKDYEKAKKARKRQYLQKKRLFQPKGLCVKCKKRKVKAGFDGFCRTCYWRKHEQTYFPKG